MLLLFFVFSCAEEVIKKPEDLIPRDKMSELLYELAILNAAKNTDKGILEDHFENPTEFLFRKYGVDSLQFVKSDMYYASQPLVYEAMYEEIADRLDREKQMSEEARKNRNDSLIYRGKPVRDSLNVSELD